jgi:hypothetical protein
MMHGPSGSTKFKDAFAITEANSANEAAARIGLAGAASLIGLATVFEGWNLITNYGSDEPLSKGSAAVKHLSRTVKLKTIDKSIKGSISDC